MRRQHRQRRRRSDVQEGITAANVVEVPQTRQRNELGRRLESVLEVWNQISSAGNNTRTWCGQRLEDSVHSVGHHDLGGLEPQHDPSPASAASTRAGENGVLRIRTPTAS
jgi:hypothetical protein